MPKAAGGTDAALQQKLLFPWSEKKSTGQAKFGGQEGGYLLRENVGFHTDLGEIMREFVNSPFPNATERGWSQQQTVKEEEERVQR